jgi:iron complex transport system permease protein
VTATLLTAGPSGRAREVVRGARTGVRRRHRLVVVGLAVALLAAVAVRVLLGDFTVTIPDFFRILTGTQIPGASYIVMDIKLPRALLGAMVGLTFGVAGAIFQATLRNPLASPDIIGLNLGASAAAVFALVTLDLQGLTVSAVAVAGGVAVAVAVRFAAGRHSRGGDYRLVLVGVAFASGLLSVIHYLLTRADVYDAQLALRWLAGSVSAADWPTVRLLGVLLLLVLPLVVEAARWLPVLELGHDASTGLGVRPWRADLLLLLGVVLGALAVAASGPVAFVAFASGPIARALNGGRTTLAGSALVGAVVVVGADFIAASLLPGGNYPVGVVTGALGAPFLLWLLTRSRAGGRSG